MIEPQDDRKCLICEVTLSGKRLKFCCRSHAMAWHNSQTPWRERKDRHRKNAARKQAYHADVMFWRNKARKWREDNPEKAALFAQQQKERYWISPWRKLIIAAKGRAKQKSLPFDLTFEWGEAKWTGFCEVSKLPFQARRDASHGIFSPSIDRIDSTKGYTQDNSRFVLMGINGLKIDGTDAELYLVAEAIIENMPKPLVLVQKAAPAKL